MLAVEQSSWERHWSNGDDIVVVLVVIVVAAADSGGDDDDAAAAAADDDDDPSWVVVRHWTLMRTDFVVVVGERNARMMTVVVGVVGVLMGMTWLVFPRVAAPDRWMR